MSSYETLLESYDEEINLSNITFEEVGNILESLTEFVNEELDMTVQISLQEAEEGEVAEKENKFTAGAKRVLSSLVAKLNAFIEKIGDAIRKFVAKAKVVIAQGGNTAVAKIAANSKAKLGKEITLKTFSQGPEASVKLMKLGIEAMKKANEQMSRIAFNGDAESGSAAVEKAVDAFAEKLENSPVMTDKKFAAGQGIKSIYNDNCKKYIDAINSELKNLEAQVKNAQQASKTAIKTIQKLQNTDKAVKSANITAVSKTCALAMKINTYSVNYAASLLGIAAKNGAKLALAAVGEDGKKLAGNVKAKGTDLKNKGKNLADKAKDKLPKKAEKNEEEAK